MEFPVQRAAPFVQLVCVTDFLVIITVKRHLQGMLMPFGEGGGGMLMCVVYKAGLHLAGS